MSRSTDADGSRREEWSTECRKAARFRVRRRLGGSATPSNSEPVVLTEPERPKAQPAIRPEDDIVALPIEPRKSRGSSNRR
jgi:hypothetical protein